MEIIKWNLKCTFSSFLDAFQVILILNEFKFHISLNCANYSAFENPTLFVYPAVHLLFTDVCFCSPNH